jgi:hypothetical protein
MVAHSVEEHLEGRAVVQVLAGVELKSDIDARRVEGVEDGRPAFRQLVERRLDQPGRALRPRVNIRPGERAGEGGVREEA